jgi:hypothetical protein
MAEQFLATYLNDHLAGSVAALELLAHLEQAHARTPIASLAEALRTDISGERNELEMLMARLQITVSRPRKAMAWVAEKVSELKLRLDDPTGGALSLLQLLEALSIGIEGKRLLWRSLGAAQIIDTSDSQRLEQQSDQQRRRVEMARLEAAKGALTRK